MSRPEVLSQGVLPGALAGIAGGLAFGAAMTQIGMLTTVASLVRADSAGVGFFVHMGIAAIIGAGFGVLVWHQRPGTGETLFWGLAYGTFWWFLGALTLLPLLTGQTLSWDVQAAQEQFPALLGHLLYGGVVGLALVALKARKYAAAGAFTVSAGALLRGLIAGLAGAWLLGIALDAQIGVPAISAMMTDESRFFAWLVTLLVGALAGLGYALLYPKGTDGSGPALIRGTAYGFLWWVAVAVTLLPLIDTGELGWSLQAVRAGFGTLPGYLLFLGAMLALFYQWLTALMRLLFSDDIRHSSREAPGTRGLRSVGLGALAGLVGGLVFTVVMVQIGFLPTVASLIGSTSALVGFLVHLLIAFLIGASYGLLFRRQSYDTGAAVGWGVSYGFFWWLMGPLTLLPILLGSTPQWTIEAASAAFPALIGHLAYGAFLGVTFYRLESGYSPWWITRTQAEATRVERRKEQLLTSAPALWALIVAIALSIPVLLGG